MTPVNSGSLQNFTGVYFLLKQTGIDNRMQRNKGLCGEANKIKKTKQLFLLVMKVSIFCVKLTSGLKCQTKEGDLKKCQAEYSIRQK